MKCPLCGGVVGMDVERGGDECYECGLHETNFKAVAKLQSNIKSLTKLVNAVDCYEFGGVELADVYGCNWFDFRERVSKEYT